MKKIEKAENKKGKYYIKHATENRYFNGLQDDYWKKWSLSNVIFFDNYYEALDVLDRLNDCEKTLYEKNNHIKSEIMVHTIVGKKDL